MKTLPILNPEAFRKEPEPEAEFWECNHLVKSREDPDTDFEGYMIKVVFWPSENTLYAKLCPECLEGFPKPPEGVPDPIVARVPYLCLSQSTLAEHVLNTDLGTKVIPVSNWGKRIVEEIRKISKEVPS